MRALPRFLLVLQLILLGVEVFTRYDTAVRQAALAVSNVAGVLILGLVATRLKRWGSHLPPAVAWLVAAAIWFDASGNFVHFYARFTWWDQLAHAVGSAAIAAALWLTLRAALAHRGVRLPDGHVFLYAVSAATLLAVSYEISEYLGDLLFNTHRVTNLYDTADDLLWNLLAAWLAVAVVRRVARPIDPTGQNQ